MAAGYLIGAAALVLLIRERPGLARREAASVVALGGTSAYGIVLFFYFVDRSAFHVLVYVSLPLVIVGTIWLALLMRNRESVPRGVLTGVIAFALALSVLLLSVAWPSIGPRFERSALAHAARGGPSLAGALERLWAFPPIDIRSPAGERMLARHMPGEDESVVLVQPNMITEVLMRSERSNRLPLSNPVKDGFAEDATRPGLLEAAAQLEPGTRMLLDESALRGLRTIRGNPRHELLNVIAPGAPTTPLELQALREIDRRFVLRPVARADGFVVVELERR